MHNSHAATHRAHTKHTHVHLANTRTLSILARHTHTHTKQSRNTPCQTHRGTQRPTELTRLESARCRCPLCVRPIAAPFHSTRVQHTGRHSILSTITTRRHSQSMHGTALCAHTNQPPLKNTRQRKHGVPYPSLVHRFCTRRPTHKQVVHANQHQLTHQTDKHKHSVTLPNPPLQACRAPLRQLSTNSTPFEYAATASAAAAAATTRRGPCCLRRWWWWRCSPTNSANNDDNTIFFLVVEVTL